MHPHDASQSIPAEPDAVAPNPIHVVGAIAAKELAAARLEALREFHRGLDEADRNLRALLPPTRPKGPARPSARFIVTDESPALDQVHAGLVGPFAAVDAVDAVGTPTFELWAPWYVDAADAAGQPA